ncbi:MAG: NAD(P)(+) transhydrogenase (Re/Si-specific) subunit beta, partial [Cocleimonas sp.]|nr:NAD(P)(+) transhydrogenase (Re/Si-specific) subunit beta [Cocleimonas sp.]
MNYIVEGSYFIAAILFILGLKQMSSPMTARRGIIWAGVGMVLATVITYFHQDIHHNYFWMTVAIGIGGTIAYVTAKKVKMTDMPQMIALYNGMGGGAAAAIAAVVLMQNDTSHGVTHQSLAVLGALIGTIAFSGSMIAFAKLQGIMWKVYRFENQQWINLGVFLTLVLMGLYMSFSGQAYGAGLLFIFFVLALAFGVMMTIPIGGADMPVVISLYNAFTGLAVGFEGYVLGNPAMMIA